MPANGLRVNHYDFVALHSIWIIFLKGYCVLVRVEIIHKSVPKGRNGTSLSVQTVPFRPFGPHEQDESDCLYSHL